MPVTKKEFEYEIESLKELGLSEEEIEGYFDFFSDIFKADKVIEERKIKILNLRRQIYG